MSFCVKTVIYLRTAWVSLLFHSDGSVSTDRKPKPVLVCDLYQMFNCHSVLGGFIILFFLKANFQNSVVKYCEILK